MKKTVEKKPKQITLYFDSKSKCQDACNMLQLSPRKVTDIDKSHGGDYSKHTGHYALVVRSGVTFKTRIRAKLIVDETLYDGLTDNERLSLGYVDITSKGWIAP